jgi:hypothetical protein
MQRLLVMLEAVISLKIFLFVEWHYCKLLQFFFSVLPHVVCEQGNMVGGKADNKIKCYCIY